MLMIRALLVLLLATVAHAQPVSPGEVSAYYGLSHYAGDTHVHYPGMQALHSFYTRNPVCAGGANKGVTCVDDGECPSSTCFYNNTRARCQGGSNPCAECKNGDVDCLGGGTCEAGALCGDAVGDVPNPPDCPAPSEFGEMESHGLPDLLYRSYRAAGYDWVWLTPHASSLGLLADSNWVTWARDPAQRGNLEAFFGNNAVQSRYKNCGYPDWLSGGDTFDGGIDGYTGTQRWGDDDNGCLAEDWNPYSYQYNVAEYMNRLYPETFVAGHGAEFSTVNWDQGACEVDPLGGIDQIFRLGHVNILYSQPSGVPVSHGRVVGSGTSIDDDGVTYFAGNRELYRRETALQGTVITNNHNGLTTAGQTSKELADSCYCGSGWTAVDECDTTFRPYEGENSTGSGGFNDLQIDLVEVQQSSANPAATFKYSEGYLGYLNFGFGNGITLGSDRHWKPSNWCTADPSGEPLSEWGAVVVWSSSLELPSLVTGLKGHRTYAVNGFHDEPGRLKVEMQDGAGDRWYGFGGNMPLPGDGTVTLRVVWEGEDAWANGATPGCQGCAANNLADRVEIWTADTAAWTDAKYDWPESLFVVDATFAATAGDVDSTDASFSVGSGWYIAVVLAADDRQLAMSSPIWVDRCAYVSAQKTAGQAYAPLFCRE